MAKPDEEVIDAKRTGFSTIEFVGRLVISILMRFWAVCTTTFLILILTYWLYGGWLVLFMLFAALIGLGYHSQDLLLYYPEQPSSARLFVESPAAAGLPYENIFIDTKDGVKIHMYLILQPHAVREHAPTLIYFHGNAGNIGHRLLNSRALYSYVGCNVLLVEYRGYGKSGGTPNEQGFYCDACAAMEFLLGRSDLNHNKVMIFGRSLGGAVAVYLASQPAYSAHILCLILENTFTSLPHIGAHLFSHWLTHLPLWAYKNKFPSMKRLESISIPTLLLSGLADQLIPPRMMQQCYEASASSLKRLARFEQGTHNETWQCPGYYESINRFLAEVARCEQLHSSDKAVRYNMNIPFDDGGRHYYSL